MKLLIITGFFSLIALSGASSALFSPSLDALVAQAQSKYGDLGKHATLHLLKHMPNSDREQLNADFLEKNIDLAFQARGQFRWSREVSEELFINDVVPYAVMDEPRDPWRAEFLKLATPIVKEARTAEEAVQLLNQHFFNTINVHYDTGRKRANQSPKESMKIGKASCTGLSIILVNACRSVGIPARAAGIPLWPDKRGNHTWVEIHDGKRWRFTGADEYDAKGLDRGWFKKKAGEARKDHPLHAIYATSWSPKGTHFPVPWNPRNKSIGAINVSERYIHNSTSPTKHQLGIRLFAAADRSSRIATEGQLTHDGVQIHSFTTKAGAADLNDMPQVVVEPGKRYRLVFEVDGKSMQSGEFAAKPGISTMDVQLNTLQPIAVKGAAKGLSKKEASKVGHEIYQELLAKTKNARAKEMQDQSITLGDKSMKWLEKTFGDAPAGKRSLWISMHGGGGGPARMNDGQWQNQIKLYQPKEGIYLAPRAPTNTWNLWHQDHIDPLFNRLIENMVALRGVDPDKVYLMGYSAGGDGVWQLAPRMADRYAAASMMAGHPNEAKMLGLRNLPFGIFCGEKDTPYKRNIVCAERMRKIADMAAADPDPAAYVHMTRLYQGMGHWMKLRDAESLPWMASFTRKTWPRKIVWYQDDVTHDRFYWLEVPEGVATKDHRIDAEIKGQSITLKGDIPMGMSLLLHDSLLDLDQEVTVIVNGGKPSKYQPKRSREVMRQALEKRLDPKQIPTAKIVLN